MNPETEIDDLKMEIRDYKAAVKFMHALYKRQMERYHVHLNRVHQSVDHRALWKDCPGSPCVFDREDLVKVEAVMKEYKLPGDPRGEPGGAAFQTASAKAVSARKIAAVSSE